VRTARALAPFASGGGTTPTGSHQPSAISHQPSAMRVVNVRAAELRKAGFPSLVAWLAADARHVYVGRRCAYV
jgi:hypothetical protein